MNKMDLLTNDLVSAINGVLEWHDENLSDGVNREYSIKVLRDALQSFQQSVQSDALPCPVCGGVNGYHLDGVDCGAYRRLLG